MDQQEIINSINNKFNDEIMRIANILKIIYDDQTEKDTIKQYQKNPKMYNFNNMLIQFLTQKNGNKYKEILKNTNNELKNKINSAFDNEFKKYFTDDLIYSFEYDLNNLYDNVSYDFHMENIFEYYKPIYGNELDRIEILSFLQKLINFHKNDNFYGYNLVMSNLFFYFLCT